MTTNVKMAGGSAAATLELEPELWDELVAALHRELWRIASVEDCQDAVQEAFEDALRRPGLAREHLRSWLLVVARRRLLDQHRARVGVGHSDGSRRTFVSAELRELEDVRVSERELVELLDDGADGEASATLARLDGPQRQVLTLAVEGNSYPEIGDVLGVSAKAAKERTLRAWIALRTLFIATETSADCHAVRRLLVRHPRAARVRSQQDRSLLLGHLDACPHCRAFEKRLKGLIATTPAPSAPLWQQVLLRVEQLLTGVQGSGAESSAGALLRGGGGLARVLGGLCATAAAAGICVSVVAHPPSTPRATHVRHAQRLARVPSPTPQATSTPTATPTPVATASPTPSHPHRRRHRDSDASTAVTGNEDADTRSVDASRPASAPPGSTATSEFAPSGAGSSATPPPAPAPGAGGGEFSP